MVFGGFAGAITSISDGFCGYFVYKLLFWN